MSEDVAEGSDEALTPVTRVRVQVRADAFVYQGLVTLLPDSDGLQSVLNDPRPFLNMTDVEIFDAATGTTYSTAYLALNKGAITHVVLVDEELAEGIQSAPQGEPAATSAVTSAAPRSPLPVAAAPTLPPQAPPSRRTPHSKIPVRPRHDPPTQPFPGLDDELSDLILDDEGDDIDPADLLGASGEYKSRSFGK